jgi:hypothetical protein
MARVAVAQMTKIFIVGSIEPPGPETRADGSGFIECKAKPRAFPAADWP